MAALRSPRGMAVLTAGLRLYIWMRDLADEIQAALCSPNCPHHPERMIMPTPNDQEREPRNPLKNLPGETPARAQQRARNTIEQAAARGNPLAQKMLKAQAKEDRKRGVR